MMKAMKNSWMIIKKNRMKLKIKMILMKRVKKNFKM